MLLGINDHLFTRNPKSLPPPDLIYVSLGNVLSIGQLTQPFPAGAPAIKDLWEKETGITLEIVGVPNGQEFTKAMQDISTKGGAYDIYAVDVMWLAEYAAASFLEPLMPFVKNADLTEQLKKTATEGSEEPSGETP